MVIHVQYVFGISLECKCEYKYIHQYYIVTAAFFNVRFKSFWCRQFKSCPILIRRRGKPTNISYIYIYSYHNMENSCSICTLNVGIIWSEISILCYWKWLFRWRSMMVWVHSLSELNFASCFRFTCWPTVSLLYHQWPSENFIKKIFVIHYACVWDVVSSL